MNFVSFWRKNTPWTTAASGFLCSLASLLLLTLFGGMYTPLIILALTPLFLGLGSAILKLTLERDWTRAGLIFVVIFIAWLNLTGETPSIFTGRDQGSIAEAAWQLAHTHQLTWTNPSIQAFFDIYGPGTALNFPGFAYTQEGSLITQFPLGYTAWLAGFVGWLGLTGYHVANTLLFLMTSWGFFELTALFVRKTLAVIGTSVLSLSFLSIWMLHYTLTENLAAPLFILLAFGLIKVRRHPHQGLWYWLSLGPATLFLFTRIEGFILFGLTLLFMLFGKAERTFLRERPLVRIFLPLILLSFVFLRDFFLNVPFYKMIGKAVLKNWQELLVTTGTTLTTSSAPSENLFHIFTTYGMILFFGVGTFGIALALWKEKRETLILLILALPTFIYLIDGHITPDHPWMLRRYFFTLWPTFLFFSVFAWHLAEIRFARLRQSQVTLLLVLLLIFIQYPSARAAWQIDEHTALFTATQALADRLSGDDLVLVDRLTTGDPFRLLAGPLAFLFEKQAVYFFNPEDLHRLPLNSFHRVILLVPEEAQTSVTTLWGRELYERATFDLPLSTTTARESFFPRNTLTTTRVLLFEIKP